MAKTWFITGANRGLGAAIARPALETGHRVVTTARDPEQIGHALSGHGDRLVSLRLDVTSSSQIEDCITAIKGRIDRIDILVCNAGYGPTGMVRGRLSRADRSPI